MHDLATIVRRNNEAVEAARVAARMIEKHMGEASEEDVIGLARTLAKKYMHPVAS